MTTLSQSLRGTAHYLVSEANGYLSREQIVVASGSGKLDAGTVLGRVTATKKFVPLDPAATNGAEVAAAILYEACDATDLDVRRTITARHAEVHADVLVWGETVTDAQKTTALTQLAGLGIAAR
jgi:hypothetical protein